LGISCPNRDEAANDRKVGTGIGQRKRGAWEMRDEPWPVSFFLNAPLPGSERFYRQ